MSIAKVISIFGAITVTLFIAGCEKTPSKSPEASETDRRAVSESIKLAETLAQANPRHDRQYFLDRIAQIVSECGDNVNTCVPGKIKALQDE